MVRWGICLGAAGGLLWGQLIPAGTPVPKKDKPPVVFLNGYQGACTDHSFASTFGIADQVLQANGEVSLFFDNCTAPGKSIEELGAAFGSFLANLKYDDGQPVITVDAVAHSMGGLILRSYLSGKQTGADVFQPPASVPIRKIVFIATPHFGTQVASFLGSDTQTREMASGSTFLFDLGTWNQGTDDLRGTDALALAGDGGTGKSFLLPSTPGFDDGVVTLTNASIAFARPGRTRVLPFCHTVGGGLITLGGLCDANARGIASIQSASDPQSQILVSFLNGTNDWMNIGTAAESDPFLSKDGGLDIETRTAADAPLTIGSATATPAGGAPQTLGIQGQTVAFTDRIVSGPMTLSTVSGSTTTTASLTLPPAVYKAVVLKPGPVIGRVFPAASVTFPLSVAPGQFVAIYGVALAGSTATAGPGVYPTQLADVQVTVGGTPAQLYYVSAAQIDAVIPDGASGLVKLTVQNTSGSNSVNVLVASAVPALFTQDSSGAGAASALNASTGNSLVTAASPLHAGEYVSLFLTGLGATTVRSDGLSWANQQPTVSIGGQACVVTYAGRAPGFTGLDQINCVVPAGLSANAAAQVIVTSGGRGSNIATLAVQ